ncbi:heavy-metal-associated domain-containing protein [Halogeometricum luteum]|uniref:heavy-metal-associated domain-containing protein n=1 Tax=Halogeometricum luteum TaxID=2950537 RepID=UPI003CCD7E29
MATTIAVEGLSCEHRERAVEAALRGVDGVTAAAADRAGERANTRGMQTPRHSSDRSKTPGTPRTRSPVDRRRRVANERIGSRNRSRDAVEERREGTNRRERGETNP